MLVKVSRCGFRVEGIEAEALALRAVVQKTAVQNVLWAEVVLQADQIIAGPLRGSVGVIGQLPHQRKCVLQADGIRKPEAAPHDGARKSKARIPVSQAHAILNIDAGDWISRAEAPLVVAFGRFQIQNARARDRKSTRLNSSHQIISYAVFCLKKKKDTRQQGATKPTNTSITAP